MTKKGIKILSIGAAIIVLATGFALIKNNHDHRNLFDENGKAKRITCVVEESYLNDAIIYENENGQEIKKFRTPHVYFLIEKETGEVKKHLYFTSRDKWYLFELDTLEMIKEDGISSEYYKRLKTDYDWIPLTSAPMYMGYFDMKEAYTKEEIDEMEPAFIEGFNWIEEAARNK